jgi:hypothetical protein
MVMILSATIDTTLAAQPRQALHTSGLSWTEYLQGHQIVRNLRCEFQPALGSQERRLACTVATGPESFKLIHKSPDIRVFGALASQCILGEGRKVRVVGRCVFDFHARDQIRSSSSVDEMSSQPLEQNTYTSCIHHDDSEDALFTHACCNLQVVKNA